MDIRQTNYCLRKQGASGSTLVELALVVLLIGLVLALGTAGWGTLAASRRMARTRADLYRIKQCLVRHVASSGRYPTYASAADCSAADTDLGVCLCREGALDVWGNGFLYLAGQDSSGGNLAGQAVRDSAYAGLEAADAAAASQARDRHGRLFTRVAFVLFSLGPNGGPDGDYDAFPAGATARTLEKTADFSGTGADFDDIFLIVTARELRAAVRD